MKPHKHAEVIKAWADGAVIQYRDEGGFWADVTTGTPTFRVERHYRIKPAPKWPRTTMSDRALEIAYTGHEGATAICPEPDEWRRIANAALAHSLETGQVVLPAKNNYAYQTGLTAGDQLAGLRIRGLNEPR